MKIELLPCPFCGETRIDYETTVTERAIRCTRCSAKIVRDISTVLPEHVWNTRAERAERPADVREAVKIAKRIADREGQDTFISELDAFAINKLIAAASAEQQAWVEINDASDLPKVDGWYLWRYRNPAREGGFDASLYIEEGINKFAQAKVYSHYQPIAGPQEGDEDPDYICDQCDEHKCLCPNV